jgi:hypothetical protein
MSFLATIALEFGVKRNNGRCPGECHTVEVGFGWCLGATGNRVPPLRHRGGPSLGADEIRC